MIVFILAIVLALSKATCPDGYYGKLCDIRIPGTARIVGKFENYDCMLGFKSLDGFIIDYEVPQTYLPVVVTNCNDILTDEARNALFNSTYANTECTWKSHPDPLVEKFVEVHVRGIIDQKKTQKFAVEKEFPIPFPVKVLQSEKTVNIQLGWFDVSHVIQHLCAPTKTPGIKSLAVVVSISGVCILLSIIFFCLCLVKPEVDKAIAQIFDLKEETENDTDSKINQQQDMYGSSTDFGSSSSSGHMASASLNNTTDESDVERMSQNISGGNNIKNIRTMDEEDDDLGIYRDFEEEDEDLSGRPEQEGVGDPRKNFAGVGGDKDLEGLMEYSEEDDDFSS